MNVNFGNLSFLSNDSFSGAETIVVAPLATYTTNPFSITFWDSKDGIFFTIQGTRYGTLDSDVQIKLQQATLATAPESAWSDIVAAIDFGSGGTSGSPSDTYATIGLFPQSGETLMPYLRIKVTAKAVSGATITKLYRSTRGR